VLWPESDASVSWYSCFRALRDDLGELPSWARGHCTERETVSLASCTLHAQATRTCRRPLLQTVAANVAGELRDHRPANRTVKERRL
jgi:hypothetical protein